MSLFYQIGQWLFGGLTRERGIQYTQPAYAEESATPVTFDTALQLSAAWACIKLLAETPSSLPLNFYRVNPDGTKEIDKTHELYQLFAYKPNRYQNRVEFWETVILNLVTHGNAYIQIERRAGRILSLLPLMSSQVETRLMTDQSITYQYTADSGVTIFAEPSIWHIKLMGNGIIGLSPLAYQRNTLGIAQAAERAVTKIYANGAKPSGVLKLDRLLTKEQRTEARQSFSSLTTGSGERLMVLEKGTEFQPISLSPQDIELLSSRKFQISEICRWYGVPSVMVNDNNGTTTWGSGIEQIVQGFYKLTLRPLLEKIEASMMCKLLSPEDRATMEIEFDFDALLRSDKKTMYESYKSAVNGSLMTPNEARKSLGLVPVDGGDTLFIQGAMVSIDVAANPPEPTQPDPAPDMTPQLDALAYDLRSLREVAFSIKGNAPAQPIVNNVYVPEQKHTINVEAQKAADVVVHNHLPETHVNVEAVMPEQKQVTPIVNVRNEVQPAQVTVVDNHPTEAVQTVERNDKDEILRTVTKYKK